MTFPHARGACPQPATDGSLHRGTPHGAPVDRPAHGKGVGGYARPGGAGDQYSRGVKLEPGHGQASAEAARRVPFCSGAPHEPEPVDPADWVGGITRSRTRSCANLAHGVRHRAGPIASRSTGRGPLTRQTRAHRPPGSTDRGEAARRHAKPRPGRGRAQPHMGNGTAVYTRDVPSPACATRSTSSQRPTVRESKTTLTTPVFRSTVT